MEDPNELYINTTPNIPALPRLVDKTKLDIRYVLVEPYAIAHIYFNPKVSEMIYEVEEPLLKSGEKNQP